MFCQWHDVNTQKDRSSPSAIYLRSIIIILCLYGDETQIFTSAKDSVGLIFFLNIDLNKITHGMANKYNKLQHHSTKTKLMYVGSKHNLRKINDDIAVMPNSQAILRLVLLPVKFFGSTFYIIHLLK